VSSPRSLRQDRTRTRLIIAGALVGLLAVAGTAFAMVNRPIDAEIVGLPVAGLSATTSTGPGTPTPTSTLTSTPTPLPTLTAARTYAATGPNRYEYAPGQSEVFGTAGALRKYRVAIETGTPVPLLEFAAMVDATLSDPRSWIAGNDVRLQRVPDASASFTVYLVTPGTAQKLCGAGGYDIFWRGEPYTSCRVGARVVINITRYLTSVPDYGAPVEAYQQYAINHEVGHALGHNHELCPGKGKPAPVMQQQTFDLQGCVAYFWPYLDGKRYAGPPGRIVPAG
jgi:hypothetical protein